MRLVSQVLVLLPLLALLPTSAHGHAFEPGFLQLTQLSPGNWQVFWRRPDVNGAPMKIDAELPESCSPNRGGIPQDDGRAWSISWIMACSEGLAGKFISIPGLERQKTDVLVRIKFASNKTTSTYRLTPGEPSVKLPETQSFQQVVLQYFLLGYEHILEGWDHLLFVFALLVLIRGTGPLVAAITAFTIAHSITLALATLGFVHMPGPPIEAIIALSIVFLAVEILKQDAENPRFSERFPWIVSFLFGLLHGLGFAGALTEIGLPEGDIPGALLAFNVGVEAGQLTFVFVILAAYAVLKAVFKATGWSYFRTLSKAKVVCGYLIGSLSVFWLAERLAGF